MYRDENCILFPTSFSHMEIVLFFSVCVNKSINQIDLNGAIWLSLKLAYLKEIVDNTQHKLEGPNQVV